MENAKLELAEQFVHFTGEHLFLTGKAGTGKTTFLHRIRQTGMKRMIVVAPTGVAAINAGGVTIHSFFQMPFGPILPDTRGRGNGNRELFQRRFSKQKIGMIRSIDLLVIDEISMVRADLLDGIDQVLRRFRDRRKPFGGVQLLMIGDLEQLAPVVKENEWELLRDHYESPFFFSSKVLQQTTVVPVVLDHVYRQTDRKFIDVLNQVRSNRPSPESLELLNKRVIPGFIKEHREGYIILTTHNALADEINAGRLEELESPAQVFEAEIHGDFPEQACPTYPTLTLKVGAQVMFVRNDAGPNKRFYNGKIGIIEEIEEDTVFVKCDGEEELIDVNPVEWENKKYRIDPGTHDLREEVTGTFTQYPLKPAWAITIHKSQGLTFEKAVIDVRTAFTHGQVYVALSRCKSLDGLVLNAPVDRAGLFHNEDIAHFTRETHAKPPDEKSLEEARERYTAGLLQELFEVTLLQHQLTKFIGELEQFEGSLTGTAIPVAREARSRFRKEILEVSVKFIPLIPALVEGITGRDKAESKPGEPVQPKNLPGDEPATGREMTRYEALTGKADSHPGGNAESNQDQTLLQEKVRGASRYYMNKLTEIFEVLTSAVPYQTDNREVKKRLDRSYNQIRETVHFKKRCLEACEDGFSLPAYLEKRARAHLEEPPSVRSTEAVETTDRSDIRNPGLYGQLMTWRNRMASERGVPHYMIVPVKVLVTLSNYAPSTLKEMGRVKGIGKKTLERYGDTLLEIIADSGAANQLRTGGKEK